MHSIVEFQPFIKNQRRLIKKARKVVRDAPTLKDAAARLRSLLPTWFVYQGGSHVALHREYKCERRYLLITEKPLKRRKI